MHRRFARPGFALAAALAIFVSPARAGVVNPDLSVIGQPRIGWTDAPGDPARRRPVFEVGETEFAFDAALNPYARATVFLALADEGVELEEGYFTLTRGLPAGLALKGGKYRAGFGRLNGAHPHTYPFAGRFRVLAEYLPGEEGMNETGVQLSELLALPGDASLTLSADWLQGDGFRIEREATAATNDPLASDAANGDRQLEPRAAVLGRAAAFVPIGGRSGLELGLSGTRGTNNAAAATRTTVIGGDFKLKWWTSERAYLLVQGEALKLDREVASWDEPGARYAVASAKPAGGYLYADYNFALRYNVGASFERWQSPGAGRTSNHAFGVFAGLALMEETTAFRIGWEQMEPGVPPGANASVDAYRPVNSVTLRVVYSMGPHKAHQF